MTKQEYIKSNGISWPGGYQINAITDDNEFMCYECVKNNPEVHEGGTADGWRFDGADIYWEGPTLNCCHCNKEIESEYGIP